VDWNGGFFLLFLIIRRGWVGLGWGKTKVERAEATVTQTCGTNLRAGQRVSEKIETLWGVVVKLFRCCSLVLADSGPMGFT
jgi:hypothetical protein